jgi:predicted nucleic acid-binding protein
MEKRFYVDTSIWRDYIEDRSDGIRPLGEFAAQFFGKCVSTKSKIIFSKVVLFELKCISENILEEGFFQFKEILLEAKISQPQIREAKRVSRKKEVQFNDAIHSILARDNNAVVITRDAHFELLLDIADAKKPEEIVFD